MFSKIDESNAGKRVKLISTKNQKTKLKPGDKGTYMFSTINPGLVQHSIKWDNGSTLVLTGGRDKFEFITEKEMHPQKPP